MEANCARGLAHADLVAPVSLRVMLQVDRIKYTIEFISLRCSVFNRKVDFDITMSRFLYFYH